MLEVRHFSFYDNDLGEPYVFPNSLIPITYEELKNNYKQPNYIAFDGLGIDLTDDNKVFYNYEYAGLVSSEESDENASSNAYMSFPISKTLPDNISFVFYDNCCKKILVQYTLDTILLKEQYIYPDNNVVVIPINPISDSTGERAETLKIYFETVIPYQLIKLQGIIVGKVNTFKKFRSYSMLEEINILSSDLPMNSFECEVVTDEEFNEGDPLNIYSNNTYYGTFFISEIERTQKKAYLLKCYNCIYQLEKNQFAHGVTPLMSLPQLITMLEACGGVEIYSLSSIDMSYVDIFGNIPIKSSRFAIAAIAFASRLMINASRHHGINLLDIPTDITSIINSNRILGKATFKKTKTVTSAIWQYPSYYEQSDKTITISATVGQRIKVIFDKPFIPNYIEIEDLKTKTTIFSLTSNYIDFIPVTEKTILTGIEYTFISEEVVVTNPNATEKSKENIISFKDFNLEGEFLNEKDGFYQTLDKTVDIQKYISSRGTVSAKIILNGEKVGDLVTIETELDGMITGIITSMVPKFGYRDTAEIEVYEWPVG